jgi:hypothetical protein
LVSSRFLDQPQAPYFCPKLIIADVTTPCLTSEPQNRALLTRAEILNLITYADGLDVTNRPDGTGGYEDLKRGARHEPLGEELHIAITSLENIIRSKTASGRADDLAALPQL